MLKALMEQYNQTLIESYKQDYQMCKLVEGYAVGLIALLEDMQSYATPINSRNPDWQPKFGKDTYGWLDSNTELQQIVDTITKLRQALQIINTMKPGPVKAKHSGRVFSALNMIRPKLQQMIKQQSLAVQDEEQNDSFEQFMTKFFPDIELEGGDGNVDPDDQLWDEDQDDSIEDLDIDDLDLDDCDLDDPACLQNDEFPPEQEQYPRQEDCEMRESRSFINFLTVK